MDKQNTENAILSTFLFANDTGDDLSKVYPLDNTIFTSPFRKRVADKLNGIKDDAYGFELVQIEESVKGTRFEQDYIDMIAQNTLGLGFSKKYHDKLVEESKMGDIL